MKVVLWPLFTSGYLATLGSDGYGYDDGGGYGDGNSYRR
jgi:hypothetical protein